MSTYDERLLGARFAALAPEPLAANWDDVLGRAGAARENQQPQGRSRARQGHRRRFLVVLAAAIIVVLVGTAAAFGIRSFILERGFIGLPPEGATPSSPVSGELEIFYKVDPSSWGQGGGTPGAGRTLGRNLNWVYADGRLIRWGSNPAGSANPLFAGFLEQRLTPEGVELLRSEILSSGEFGDEVLLPPCAKDESPSDGDCQLPTPPPVPDQPLTVPFYTTIEVAGLGHLVHVDRARDLERLEERLSDPASWLPESAWADKDMRAYVASKYAVCYSGWPPDQQIERSRLVALLPSAVRDRLGDASRRQGPLFGEPGHFRPSYEYCSDLTTDEARAVAVALDDAGLERRGAARLNYEIEAPGSNPGQANVWFEPYLPHGEIICSVCG